jgi:large subunit ribosomal protein L21
MEYAIVKISGKQYKVSPGDLLDVDKLKTSEKTVKLNDVLLHVSDGKVKVGKPTVSGLSVTAKVLGDKKGDKVRVMKYKAKVRYRRATGFRAQLTSLQIESIGSGAPKKETSAKTKKTA